jgi:hypothetical protein
VGQIVPWRTELLVGGEVNTKPSHEVGLSEAASAVNLDPREYRGAKTRNGRETFAGTNGSGYAINGIKAWQRNSGTNYLLYKTTTTFWSASAGGTASVGSGGTADALMAAVPLDNILVVVADGLTPQKWPAATDLAALGGSPPAEAKYAVVYSSKVFLSGNDAAPQTIYFSATNNAEQYDSVAAPNDAGSITSQEGGGDTVQGLRSCRKWMCIFYRYYTEILIGNTVFNFAIDRLCDHGLVSQTGHCGTGDVAFFASDEAVWMVAGARASDITTAKVRTWYQAISDKSKITLALKGDLLIVIDYGSGVAMACDYKTGRWTTWPDQYWKCADTANDQTLYAGPAGSTVQVHKLDTGSTDGASAINAYWRTGGWSFGRPEAKKNLAGLYVHGKASLPTTTVTWYMDGVAHASTKDLTYSATTEGDWKMAAPKSGRANYWSFKVAWSGPGTLYGLCAYGEVTAGEGPPNES